MTGIIAGTDAYAIGYVDGISDQNIASPSWHEGLNGESYFANFFASTWLPAGHIKYARYVVPWTAMGETQGPGTYPTRYMEWCAEAKKYGLVLDMAPTTYTASFPKTTAEYKQDLSALITAPQCSGSIAYVEAWNEPNGGKTLLTPLKDAEYTLAAYELCKTLGCHVIAGDFVDYRSESEIAKYEDEYAAGLKGLNISDWAIHPYTSVDIETFARVQEFVNHMPQSKKLWFTEVGAYKCERGENYLFRNPAEQGEHANWLVNQLSPHFNPDHVFYYQFISRNCSGRSSAGQGSGLVQGSSRAWRMQRMLRGGRAMRSWRRW
ncbi:MAG: hypothetical protein ACREU3_10030, partial [Steroidobacteraceae bacterium]